MSDKKNKDKKHDRQKRGLKLFFIPKAHGQKHKHKKNKYYVNNHSDEEDGIFPGSIMSGDSPAHNNRTAEVFDYSPPSDNRPRLLDSKPLSDGRTSPVPTTSKDVGVQSGADEKSEDKIGKGEVQAAVVVEPGGGKDKDDDKDFLASPTLNNDGNPGDRERDDERRGKNNSNGYGGRDKKDRKEDKFKKNGNMDKLDGVFGSKDKKQQDDEEDDNCIVKCLYVTMTCCECTIM